MPDRQWHALVIGVDRYPAFPQRQLSGCVNDANAIRQFLLERVLVPEANLRCLTSPREPATTPAASAATAANIRAEFAALVARINAADHVVLFYAGHGLQLSRSAAADTATNRYYGFAPEDTARDAKGYANLILGAEVHQLLTAIEAKGATATVIADTCHSGASTRGTEDDVRERALEVDQLSEGEWRDLAALHPALQPGSPSSRGASATIGRFGAYAGGDFVMLTACLDSETSKEDPRVSHGVLTHALLEELEGVSPETVRSLRWMDFYERLRRNVAQRAVNLKASSQTPSLEGRREKTVFGGEWRPFAPGFTVRVASDGTLTMDGGALQGLAPGAIIAIYPPDTSDFDNSPVAAVEGLIETAAPAASTLRLTNTAATISDLSRARLVRPGPTTTPIIVRVVAGAEPMSKAVRDACDREATTSNSFSLTDDPAIAAHAELRRWSFAVPDAVWPSPGAWLGACDGWILVRADRFGVPGAATNNAPTPDDIVAYFPDAGPAIGEITAGEREVVLGGALANGLSAYGRYLRTRDRRAGDDSLASMVTVRLRAGRGAEPADHAALSALAPLEPADGIYSLTDDHWIWAEIRVLRRTNLRLQAGWVMFSDDGNVVPLWPPEGAQPTLVEGNVVFVGFDREAALSLSKRADQQQSLYTLAVVACTVPDGAPPLNIASLAQPSVQTEFAEAIVRARGAITRDVRSRRSAVQEQPAWYAWNFRVAITAAGR